MPGIVVNTSVRTGPSTTNISPTATFFIVGRTERGPSDEAKLVTSLADYESRYGGFVSGAYTHQQVQTFFEEGGAQVYVSRVVGPSATVGTAELAVTGGNIEFTAVGAGDWSLDQLEAEIVAIGSGHAIKLYLNDTLVYNTGECASPAIAVNKLNNSTVATKYATAAVGSGATALIAVAETAFSAGDEDADQINASSYTYGTDNTSVSSTYQVTKGLTAFGAELGPGAVAIPGQGNAATTDPDGGATSTVQQDLLNHAHTNQRIALLSNDNGTSHATAESNADTASAYTYSEYGAVFHPWVKITNDAGSVEEISPEGYVAAKRAAAHNGTGPWRAYAGSDTSAKFVLGTVLSVSKAESDSLDEHRVNGIRIIGGSARIYGARSLSADEDNYRFITAREMLNYVVDRAETALEDLVFSPIDGRNSLFSKVQARLVAVLEPIRTAGGLFESFDATGRRIDYGYSVQVDEAINPLSQLAGGLVKAKVGIRVSSVADQIEVDVTKSNLTASVV